MKMIGCIILLSLVILVTIVGSRLNDWSIWRKEPRKFEGIISDIKPERTGRYWWDVIVINGTESRVFEVKREFVFRPVFGKFYDEYRALNIDDHVIFVYHISPFGERTVDEIVPSNLSEVG